MNDSDVFKRFSRSRLHQPAIDHRSELNESDETEDGREPYAAFQGGLQGHEEKRMMLMFENGQISILSYSYLMEVLCTSHQFLSLIYTNCIITLKGRGLTALLMPLQDQKIRLLQCYHPEVHHLPAEEIPIILTMKRDSPQGVLRADMEEISAS